MTTVFIVDDHSLLRDGLIHLLEGEEGFEVCGQAGTGGEALAEIPKCRPDLVLLDMSLPDSNGLELLKDLLALCPEVRVLVLSVHDEALYAERVIRAGARGYVMKGAPKSQLVGAMRRVLEGQIALSVEASSHILGGLSGGGAHNSKTGMQSLTDREFEVFELIGRGGDAHEIGDKLGISSRTVDAHRTHIREKLGLADSAELMRYAVRWVETGEHPDAG
ncbi:response regulator [Haloferula sp. A504]|uniref:response regulator n=1 Tax=Haloferula sp. A504 TaxID=3373601 RepID=UPI0031C234BB|nr:response regulator transcription factor [Verrucomicrobiaceae bacterium E54]